MVMGDNLPQLFHVVLKVSTSSKTALYTPPLAPSVCVVSSSPVFYPLTVRPHHLLLKEYAAISFVNNTCHQSPKDPKQEGEA